MNKKLLLIALVIFSSCGNKNNDGDQSKRRNNNVEAESKQDVEKLCKRSGGSFDEELSLCFCDSDQFFNLKDFRGCENVRFETWKEDKSQTVEFIKGEQRGEVVTLSDIDLSRVRRRSFLPNVLLPQGNSFSRFFVGKKSIEATFQLQERFLYENILENTLKDKVFIPFYSNNNLFYNYQVFYFKNKKHLNQINNLGKIRFSDPRTQKIVSSINLESNLMEFSSYDDEGCSLFCSKKIKKGLVELEGNTFNSVLKREYILGHLVNNYLELRPIENKDSLIVVTLDYANNPNLIYMISHESRYDSWDGIEYAHQIEVLSPFDWETLYEKDKKLNFKQDTLSNTKTNSVVMCDAGVSKEFTENIDGFLNIGPNKESVLGWGEKVSTAREALNGVMVFGDNLIDQSLPHVEPMLKKHNVKNVISMDWKSCFLNFRNVKKQLKQYQSLVVNVSMNFFSKPEQCRESKFYKTVKVNDEFLWIFSSGNSGSLTKREESYSCPHNMRLKNTIIVGSTSNPDLGNDWVDTIYPKTDSTSEAALLTSDLLRKIKAINNKLTNKDLKRILILSVDIKKYLNQKVKSSGVINPEKAIELADVYEKELSAEELVYKIRKDDYSCRYYCWDEEEKIRKKIAKEYKSLLENYMGEI